MKKAKLAIIGEWPEIEQALIETTRALLLAGAKRLCHDTLKEARFA